MMRTEVKQSLQDKVEETGVTTDAGATVRFEGGWLLLPALAVLGGAWAFARPSLTGAVAKAAAALALVIGGWVPFWYAITRTRWSSPLQKWRGWTEVDPIPRWPYLQAQTPGAALRRRLGQARAWWRQVGRAALASPLQQGVLGVVVSLLLGLTLSREALLLSAVLLALAELATLWHAGEGEVGTLWEATALVGLPWLLGTTLPDGITGPAVLAALSLTLLVALYAHPTWLAALGPVVGLAFLTSQGHAMAAGWLVLLAIPGLMLLADDPAKPDYRRTVAPWVLAMIVLTAWVL